MNVRYLNNAATSWPKAPGVAEAVAEAIREAPSDPARSVAVTADVMAECRQKIAALLDVDHPNRIVLTNNATHALNLAIFGLRLPVGAKVVTTVTEHNSVLRPLNHLAERKGLQINFVGSDSTGKLDCDQFDRIVSEGAHLVVMNHISNVTGQVNDVAWFFEKAKSVGAVTVLDAAQSLGCIKVHPKELKADLVAFTGHKCLFGPQGTGGLYVAPHIDLEHLIVGGTGVRSDLPFHPDDMPTRLEAGTPNLPAFAGLAAALRWHEKQSLEMSSRSGYLAKMLRELLSEISGVKLYGRENACSGVVSFKLDGWCVEETGYVLNQSFGIVCRAGLHCAPLIHKYIGSAPEGTVRFSISGFNSEDDIIAAAHAVRRLAN